MGKNSKDKSKTQRSIHSMHYKLDSEQKLRLSMTEIEERQLMLRLERLANLEGLRENRTKVKTPLFTQALIDSKASDSEVLKKDNPIIEVPLIFKELSSEPRDPDEGHAVMWMSNGTGVGDKGDIMIKISVDGITKTATLVDYSEL